MSGAVILFQSKKNDPAKEKPIYKIFSKKILYTKQN